MIHKLPRTMHAGSDDDGDGEQDPKVAMKNSTTVTPKLLPRRPGPRKRIVGDLSNTAKLLAGREISGKIEAT